MYPAAHHVVLVNTETNTMEFLHHTRSVRSVQCFALSPNRELLAVAEIHHTNASSLPQGAAAAVPPSPAKTASSLAISAAHLHEQHQQHVLCIYKTASRSRVRAITLPHNSSIVSCSFSACNKFLALLEDAPTHNVTYWKVSNAKLVASCKCPSRGARIHISPSSASFLSVSGPAVLKYWVWTPTSEFKIGNFMPPLREQDHFADHVWVKEHMVALSEKGALLCFRVAADGASADLVHSYRCHHLSFVRMECITVHAKGFVVGGSAGFFSLYENSVRACVRAYSHQRRGGGGRPEETDGAGAAGRPEGPVRARAQRVGGRRRVRERRRVAEHRDDRRVHQEPGAAHVRDERGRHGAGRPRGLPRVRAPRT